MNDVIFHQNYVPTGDVIAILLCIISSLLLRSTYAVKKRNLYMYNAALRFTAASAVCSIVYHVLIGMISKEMVFWIYLFRISTYVLLTATYVCFFNYVKNLIELPTKHQNLIKMFIYVPSLIHMVAQIVGPLFEMGFYIDENLEIHQNYYTDFFRYIYVYLSVAMIVMLCIHRRRFIGKMLRCILCICAISFGLMFYQTQFLTTSYSVVSFVFPLLALLVLFHYNSFDVETSTLDKYSFRQYVEEMKEKHFSVIFLSLPGISSDRLREFSKEFLRKNDHFFDGSVCFRLTEGRMVLVYQKERNKDYKKITEDLLKEFLVARKKDDYYIVKFDKNERLADGKDYEEYAKFIEKKMQVNSYANGSEAYLEAFLKSKVIKENLEDIYRNCDLDDPRVKVFCQPVLDIKTNKFNTAEALMRLQIPELGMVFPDQFISMAEKFGYIHALSKIILNKTCQNINRLSENGYVIDRVSINFSVQELQIDTFCEEILDIIKGNHVDCNKIAIELTESKNDKDFQNMKHVMDRLQAEGIQFYLDDFGTGYSNFERIIGLPVDIVKFDRSLTILANKDEQSKFMVGSFSEIFKKAHYQILFEGIEDESDEVRCIDMNAQYLQGYRYSKPIPMEELEKFLDKE